MPHTITWAIRGLWPTPSPVQEYALSCLPITPPSRDHTVADGLDYVNTWNAGMLHSADFAEVFAAMKERRKPVFSKL